MGRVKIPPTPRAASLNDAMKAAAARIGPPTADEFANSTKVNKSANRNSLPTPRGSQDRATSEPAGKRKAPNDAKTPATLSTKDTKLALRSSAKPAAASSTDSVAIGDVTDPANEGPAPKRQKVDKRSPAPRRSARSKTAKEKPERPRKPVRSSSRAQRSSKATQEAASERATPASEQQETESTAKDDGSADGESVVAKSSPGSLGNGSDALPSPTSATTNPQATAANAVRRGSGPPIRETMSLPPPNGLVGDAVSPEALDPSLGASLPPLPVSSPPNVITQEQILSIPGQKAHYGIPPPGSWIQTPEGMVQIGATGAPLAAPNGNGQSMPPGLLLPRGLSQHNAIGANGQPLQYLPSRRGQKVKGRPPPKKASSASAKATSPDTQSPEVNDDNEEAKGRGMGPLANTYPRKQPFKAQIEFPGYPPPNAEIPANYTMWEICQLMPNSLRESNLRAFVQREWSANELCACLKDDARAILNARPGKDKTMVFQKRMERVKKDLVAKGEYDALLRSPPLRDDGRPTWVKRGNVRRK